MKRLVICIGQNYLPNSIKSFVMLNILVTHTHALYLCWLHHIAPSPLHLLWLHDIAPSPPPPHLLWLQFLNLPTPGFALLCSIARDELFGKYLCQSDYVMFSDFLYRIAAILILCIVLLV